MAARMRMLLVSLTLFSLLLSPFAPAATASSPAPAPAPAQAERPEAISWCVAGGFNGWNNASDMLWDDGSHGDLIAGDGVYSLDYTIPAAGRTEWKAVECGNWGNTHPAQNSWLNTSSASQVVKLTLDTNDYGANAGLAWLPASNIVNAWDTLPTSFTAVGDFQGWNNADPATALAAAGHGIYRLAYAIPAAGSYIGKITTTGSWDAFGADGRSADAANVPFTTTSAGETVIFLLDTNTGRVAILPNGTGAGNWCAAGDFNGWNNNLDHLVDNGTGGDLAGGDGVYSLDLTIATAGEAQWKVVECGNWGNAFPAANSWLTTSTANQVVKITFDTNNHASDAGIQWIPATHIVNAWDDLPANFTAIGSFQGWNNADPATTLVDTGKGLRVKTYVVAGAGNYTGRITKTGTWDRGFGVDGRSTDGSRAAESINVNFTVYHDNDPVALLLDGYNGRMAFMAPPAGGAGHDGIVVLDKLGFNSRDTQFRNPFGAVPLNTPVTVRLHAASNDLTAARVRVYNDRTNAESFIPMTRVADDGTFEWWEATIPGSPDPTIYWYRFLAVDEPTTAYYEDDPARTLGWGVGQAASADRSWQLTVYDPSYHTPDWIKNAVVYQIFPDRFRDGVLSNITPPGTFFYNETGTITRSLTADWNTPVCDPRATTGACAGTYSKNFYGGDLQGITEKLDYLQALGVTALYLNPVFESPSNHKYDTTDYLAVDDNFGGQAAFDALIAGAHTRGMHVILDGVFNHTSSDSIYFDRYGRYVPPDGACESTTSVYRSWYFFQPAVPAGSGPCAGDTTYTSWFGYDSLPKLDASVQAVRDLIWSNGTASVAPYWLERTGHAGADGWRLDVAGDVDPGTTGDPGNNYWEGFRDALRAVHSDAYVVGEEWGNASSWLLGQEWDATMNYQYSSAVLSFWRDTTYTDNDHNSGSSAGQLDPLTPTQLDERLHNWEERYPPEAYHAMMNLLGSHDTARSLMMLDHSTGDPGRYQDPNFDWSDAINRLKGVTLLQFTLPGAPTVYYGDEVGLVGPPSAGSLWEDDPYNRQPYPWLDASGTPFYVHLQSAGGQDVLRTHYTLLATTRNAHPALRTGDFRTLLVDDTAEVYAYGRKMADSSDAAVVILNRGAAAAPVSLDVRNYLPAGTVLLDVLNGNAPYTVDAGGYLYLASVPANGGALLVLSGSLPVPPTAPTGLAVTAEHPAALDLSWNAVAGADSYNVYRSFVTGGGYSFVANVTGTTTTDTGLTNAVRYYYVVTARNDTTLLESPYSNEASGIPHYDLTTNAWYNLQWPPEITHTISAITPTVNIYGQIWISGTTGPAGPAAGISAEVGYGPLGSPADPTWNWVPMVYDSPQGNNDQYIGNLLPDTLGDFNYATRYSPDGGRVWYYADLSGPGHSGAYGLLHVIPGSDPTPPAVPLNLRLVRSTPGSISVAWDANTEPDLAGYELFREDVSSPGYSLILTAGSVVTSYEDFDVVTGATYHYYLQAFDTSYNRSGISNVITATAEYRYVNLTFRLTTPYFTPNGTIYIVGDNNDLFGAVWDPGHTPMTQVGANTWEYQVQALDGTVAQYKYTRGDWNRVEWWGPIVSVNNRALTVDFGTTGAQLVDDSALNWRDLLPLAHTPVLAAEQIVSFTVTFNRQIQPASVNFDDFSVSQQGVPLTGTWTMTDVPNPATDPVTATMFVFTPNVAPPDTGFYIIQILPGMLGVGNDNVGLLDTVVIPIGQPTSVDVAGLRAASLAPRDLILPVTGLLALGALAVVLRRTRRK